MLLFLGSGGHGDRSTRLFGGHKGFYNRQWPLTCRHFKPSLLVSKITNSLSKQNISLTSNVDLKKHFIISRKKRVSNTGAFLFYETFKNSGGCFWKHVTFLRNTKLCRARDSSMIWHETKRSIRHAVLYR